MLDAGIGPWEEEGLVAVVTSADDIRSVWTSDLEDLAVALRLAQSVWMDDDSVADARLHGGLLSVVLQSCCGRHRSGRAESLYGNELPAGAVTTAPLERSTWNRWHGWHSADLRIQAACP
jgi:hypothetical protein